MEIPNFLGKLKGESKLEPKKFLALELTDQIVQAAVWQVNGDVTEIVSLGTPVEWDGETGTTSELVTAADATISGATEGMGVEPTEMVIGVAHSWTDQNGIVGVKRELIKTVCKELELKPLGFVVLTDSILRYLKMQEGTPATSILIQVSRDEVVLVLVRLGRIEATEVVGRSEDIVADVEEGISRFPRGDNLPSRIILENGVGSNEDLVQSLVSNDWQNKFNFLHLPKIEALPKDIAIKAIAVAGGTEVAKSIGFHVNDSVTTEKPEVEEEPLPVKKSRPLPIETEIVEPEEEIESEESDELDSAADHAEPNIVSAQAAGFTVGGSLTSEDVSEIEEADVVDDEPPQVVKKLSLPKLPVLTLPKLHFNKLSLPKMSLVVPGIILLALGVFIFAFVWLLPKATVTLMFTQKPLEESINLTLSPSATSLDASSAVVPVVVSEESVSGESSLPTTGKKTIGDPATGKVTIYNRTSLTKTFTKGTVLTAKNLKFTLDGDVTVASKSAGSDYVDVPGKAVIGLTASSIGEESNLSALTEFTIASFAKDTYVGKNEEALSGGNSKEIQVVDAADKSGLVKSLTAELLDKAKAQVESSNSPTQGYYVSSKGVEVVSEDYSDKVGEGATSLRATLELKVKVYRYNKADIATLVGTALVDKIPSGYTQAGNTPSVDLSSSEDKDGNIETSAKVTIGLIPTVNQANLADQLKGKNGNQVQTVLSSFPGLSGADVKITPLWLPPRLKSMPRNTKNIKITVVSQ